MLIIVLITAAVLTMFALEQNRAAVLRVFDLPPWVIAGLILGSGCLLLFYGQMSGDKVLAERLLAGEAFVLLTLASVGPLARGMTGDAAFRNRLRYLVTRFLWVSNIVMIGHWLADATAAQLVLPIVSVEVLLLLLLHRPSSRILDRTPVSHGLFASAAALAALLICIASPLAMYAKSEDFAAADFAMLRAFGAYFALVLSALALLYCLLDDGLRKVLTVVCVFICVMIFLYTGLFEPGLLDHFELRDPVRLGVAEQALEIAGLILLFALTAMATIYLTRIVTWWTTIVLVSVTFTSLWTAYGAIGKADKLAEALPEDHAQIIGFSPDRNVLVIMLDGFQGSFIGQLKEKDPAVLSEYDGFVWYANTLSTHAGTSGSVAALVGGQQYTVEAINNRGGQSLLKAIREAYGILPDAFIPAGYDVTHINPQYLHGCEYLDPEVTCTGSKSYGLLGQTGAAGLDRTNLPLTLTMVSLFNAAPFALKESVYDEGRWLGAYDANTQAYLFKHGDWNFLRTLTEDSHFRSDQPTFKFVQLQIPHEPHALTADCELDPETASYESEVRCVMRQIGVLLRRLKQAGAYDGTKIVLASDHGWWIEDPMFPADFEAFVPADWGVLTQAGTYHPLMLVKDFNSTGPLARSDVFLSNADLPAIVCSAIGSCDGVGPDPTVVAQPGRTLILNVTKNPVDFDSVEKFDVRRRYEVRESIFDPSNWRRLQ